MRKSAPKHVGSASKTMAEQLGLGSEVMELKLGQSFTSNNSASFHTLRYDFKPASVDMTKMATVAVGENHQVTVTVPHMDGAGTPQTIFKGSHRPYKKECVLIFDRKTGEVTLEKLTHNVQVKKTRSEPKHNKQIQFPQHQGDIKPSASKQPTRSSSTNQKKTASSHPKNRREAQAQRMASSLSTVVPRHSPLHASPSYPQKKSPQMPVAARMPVIGELTAIKTLVSPASDTDRSLNYLGQQTSDIYLSESSSDSSVDSDTENRQKAADCSPSYNNGTTTAAAVKCRYSPGAELLNEDLQLSESGSDD